MDVFLNRILKRLKHGLYQSLPVTVFCIIILIVRYEISGNMINMDSLANDIWRYAYKVARKKRSKID